MSASAIKAGEAYVEISARDQQLANALETNRQRMAGFAKNVAAVGSAALLATAAVGIKAASDMQEAVNKFDVVFAGNRDEMKAWADQFAADMGRSKREVVEFLASTQDLLVPVGIDASAAEEMSKQITGLAVDVASFNNKLDADVLRDFHSALTGGGETVKKYGVVMDVAAVNAKLLESSIDPKTATNAQKVWARWEIILGATTAAQGDATRSGDAYANQMKRLSAELEDTASAIGAALLPVATELLQTLNAGLVPLAKWITANPELVQGVFATAGAMAAVAVAIKAVNIVMANYAQRAAIAQALSGPAGWATLAISVAAVAGAVHAVNKALDETDASQVMAASKATQSLRREVTELDGTTATVRLAVESEAAKFTSQAADMRQAAADISDSIADIKPPQITAGFANLQQLLNTSAPDLDALKAAIAEQKVLIREFSDGQAQAANFAALQQIESTVLLSFSTIVDDQGLNRGEILDNARRRAAEAGSTLPIIEQQLAAVSGGLGDNATDADRAAEATVRQTLALRQAALEAGNHAEAHKLLTIAGSQTRDIVANVTERLQQQAAALNSQALAANTAELTKLFDGQKTTAEKLGDQLALLAERKRLLETIEVTGGVDDQGFDLAALDELEERLINSSTGFADNLQKIRDEIGLLNGSLSETDIKLREIAEKGLPADQVATFREALEELDAAKASAELKQAEEQKDQDLTQRADQIREALKTPEQQLQDLRKEIEALVDAKKLERADAETFLADREAKALKDLQQRDSAGGESIRRESSQDLRTSEGAGQLIALLNGSQGIEEKQYTIQKVIARNTARAAELTPQVADV